MEFIDTHTHLFSKEFKEDIAEVIDSSIQSGINKLLLPNIDENSIEAMLNLCALYPDNCYPMMGIHPCSVTKDVESQLALVKKWHSKNQFVAVGEIGMDLYWDKSLLAEQQFAFKQQLNLAKQLNLPAVIHVRDAFEETFEIVDQLNDDSLFGVFHCFSGNTEQAQHIINYGGFKLGIGGVVTFKNAGLDTVLKEIDLNHLVLETDAPYLAPVPYRGKRNKSEYIRLISKKIAEIYGVTESEIATATTKNAKEIFKLNG
mgnify:FL=1